MSLNSKEENLYRRIYRTIKTDKLRLFFAKIKQKKTHGLWYKDRGRNTQAGSVIDPRGLIVSTIVHEGLHHVVPEGNEEEIKKLENRLLKHLTVRRRKNLLKLFIEKAPTTEGIVDSEDESTYP